VVRRAVESAETTRRSGRKKKGGVVRRDWRETPRERNLETVEKDLVKLINAKKVLADGAKRKASEKRESCGRRPPKEAILDWTTSKCEEDYGVQPEDKGLRKGVGSLYPSTGRRGKKRTL